MFASLAHPLTIAPPLAPSRTIGRMRFRAIALLGLLAFAPQRSSAQASPPNDTTGTRLLADLTFHSQTFEPIRLFLSSGRKYRVQFSEPNIVLQLRSFEGKQLPMVMNVNYESDAAGRTDLELRPRVDGEFEFKPVYVYAGRPIRFQIWVLPLPSDMAQMATAPADGRMEFGAEFSIGSHGAFDNSDEHYGDAGGTVTGCATIRGIGGISGRLWGCMLGFEIEQGSTDGSFKYLYTEPRFRIVGGGGGFPGEVGVLLRLGAGDDSDGRTGSKYGFGVYGAYQPRSADGGGFSLIGSLQSQRVNASDPDASGAAAWSGSVGLGWFF